MSLSLFLSVVTEFPYYNLVFDGIITFFTIIYLFIGFKRGFLRTIWQFLFDVISIAGAYCVARFACPLFIDKIPVVLVHMLPSIGIAFALTALYKVIIIFLVGLISFWILRFGIFKKILVAIDDYNYNHSKKKRVLGRIASSLLTAGLAFTISSTVIVATNRMTQYTLFRNYETEMSETYIAKYGEDFVVTVLYKMLETDSIANPHDVVVDSFSNGKYTFEELPYYREAFYRLLAVNSVEYYMEAVDIDNNDGLVRFSQDLVIWGILAEEGNCNSLLEKFVNPIAKYLVDNGYKYEGEVTRLAPVNEHVAAYSSETYSYISTVLYN